MLVTASYAFQIPKNQGFDQSSNATKKRRIQAIRSAWAQANLITSDTFRQMSPCLGNSHRRRCCNLHHGYLDNCLLVIRKRSIENAR